MGLSIHYSGTFDPTASLHEMIEEVVEIAKVYHWKYSVYESIFPKSKLDTGYNEKIYAVKFIPPGCEPICGDFPIDDS